MTSNLLVSSKKRSEIKDLVLQLLDECNVDSLPVNLKSILKLHGILLLTSEEAVEHKILKFAYNDFDGKTIYINGMYFIIYNQKHVIGRRRWTIAHELGHIFLEHGEQSRVNEAEANYFAKELLMPMAVLVNMGATSIEDASKTCNVTGEAAGNRQKDFKRHYEFRGKYGLTKHDIAFLKQFGMYEFSKELAM